MMGVLTLDFFFGFFSGAFLAAGDFADTDTDYAAGGGGDAGNKNIYAFAF